MRNGVMVKLSGGKEVRPFPRVVGTEDAEIGFNFLIGPFGLSIRLRVICSGELDVIVELCQFSGEGRCKLWASVGYQVVMEAEAFEHMVKERFGLSGSIYGF